MPHLPRPVVTLLTSLLLMSAVAAPATAVELLLNGNFESGDFTGWQLANTGGTVTADDRFHLSTPGAPTPPVGPLLTQFPTAPNALGNAFYAVSTADQPGAHALLQPFTVPLLRPAEMVLLSFQMFVNDQSGLGPRVDSAGLDPTTGGTFNDNQHARVDLLRAGAGDFSTAPADVLANFYLGVDAGALPHPFTPYTFDITTLVRGGGTFRLRFAEVDNLSALNVGVDNVSLKVIPEPSVMALLLVGGLAGVGLGRLRGHRSPRRA